MSSMPIKTAETIVQQPGGSYLLDTHMMPALIRCVSEGRRRSAELL